MTAVESLGLPKNLDAERYVLGSILLSDDRFSDVASNLVADDFSLVKHQRIFARMAELHERGERIDRVTLAGELTKHGSHGNSGHPLRRVDASPSQSLPADGEPLGYLGRDWDEDLLALEMGDLSGIDFDLSLTGFDTGEIDALLALDEDDKGNTAPPLPESPVSQLGDLWLLGPHRVLAGDATCAEAVARLLGERKPRLKVTDPPYRNFPRQRMERQGWLKRARGSGAELLEKAHCGSHRDVDLR
jgi:hypothetical protein